MVVQLRKGEKPPFAKKPAVAEAREAKPEQEAKFRVDIDGIRDRIFELPVEPGNYFHLQGGKGYAAWSSVPHFTEDEYDQFYRAGGATKWSLHVFSMKEAKAVQLEEKIA
jgi:tricorn protease-like protein